MESLKIFGLVVLGGILLTLVAELLKEGEARVEEIENDNLRFALKQVISVVRIIVGSFNQTVVKPLKESPELNWDEEAQRKVFNDAVAEIRKNLDKKTLEILKEQYDDVNVLLGHMVEAEVKAQKDETILVIDEDVETI